MAADSPSRGDADIEVERPLSIYWRKAHCSGRREGDRHALLGLLRVEGLLRGTTHRVETMTYGPADLYVVEFPRGSAPTDVTAMLRDVTTAGIITLLDLALVRSAPDGSREFLELDEIADELGLAGLVPSAPGLIGQEDLQDLTGELTADSIALVVLLENVWARTITAAILAADAHVLSTQRLSAEVVNDVAHRADRS